MFLITSNTRTYQELKVREIILYVIMARITVRCSRTYHRWHTPTKYDFMGIQASYTKLNLKASCLKMMSDNAEIISIIETLFQTGVTKDMSHLREIHLDDPRFSSFSDLPPYDLKDYQTTIELEELRFISISDYEYTIKHPKISMYDNTAVVAVELVQSGMLVDNKAFTGEHVKVMGRATFVLVKQPTWKIAHIHMSRTDS